MRCLASVMLSVSIGVSAFAQQSALPQKIAEYLKATNEEAAIPLWDLSGELDLSLVFGTFRDSLHVGKLGFVSKIKVLQIIDDSSARVTLHWRCPIRYKIVGPRGATYYKMDEVRQENVVLRGMPTAGMVDEATYRIDEVLEVSGTETYITAIGGSKTVFVLKPINMEPFKGVFTEAVNSRKGEAEKRKEAAIAEAKAAAKKQARDELERVQRELTRTWTDASGKFTVVGQLVEVLPGAIAKIRKEDETTIELKLFQLSRRDREWILNEGKALLLRVEQFD